DPQGEPAICGDDRLQRRRRETLARESPDTSGANSVRASGPGPRNQSLLRCGKSSLQDLDDGGHRVPVAGREPYPEKPIQRAEVADRFHVAPVLTDDEPPLARQRFMSAMAARRKSYRQGWRQARGSRQQ